MKNDKRLCVGRFIISPRSIENFPCILWLLFASAFSFFFVFSQLILHTRYTHGHSIRTRYYIASRNFNSSKNSFHFHTKSTSIALLLLFDSEKCALNKRKHSIFGDPIFNFSRAPYNTWIALTNKQWILLLWHQKKKDGKHWTKILIKWIACSSNKAIAKYVYASNKYQNEIT